MYLDGFWHIRLKVSEFVAYMLFVGCFWVYIYNHRMVPDEIHACEGYDNLERFPVQICQSKNPKNDTGGSAQLSKIYPMY
mgnify:CR=1 FL=1